MIKTVRKLSSVLSLVALCVAIVTIGVQTDFVNAAQQTSDSTEPKPAAVALADASPQWRHTRLGWQDANEWAMANHIVHPPRRPFDHLHPVTLTLLIVLSVLISVLWASSEQEITQLFNPSTQESSNQPSDSRSKSAETNASIEAS